MVADFGQLTTLADYEKIADQIKDLDIAILIPNAGFADFKKFVDQTRLE